MDNILVLTDFSEVSNHAVEAAFELASIYNAGVTIGYCLQVDEFVTFDITDNKSASIYSQKNSEITSQMEAWKTKSIKNQVKANLVFMSGDLIESTLFYNKVNFPDLLILGSKGLGKKHKDFYGSHAVELVENLDCPILIIKEKMTDYYLDNIVFASGFMEKDKSVFLRFVSLINPPQDATIHLVAVDTSSFYGQPSVMMHKSMEGFKELIQPIKTKIHFYKDYDISAGIRHISNDLKIDLLVMANRKGKSLKHLFMGNETIDALVESKFPVLILND